MDFAPHIQIGVDETFVIKVERISLSCVGSIAKCDAGRPRVMSNFAQLGVNSTQLAASGRSLTSTPRFYPKPEGNLKLDTVEKQQRTKKNALARLKQRAF